MQTSGKTQRSIAQIKEHYEVEKELANMLRQASKKERRNLYNFVYDERLKRIPHHPLLTQASDYEKQMAAVMPQARLLRHFLKQDSIFLEIGPGDCALALEIARSVKEVYAVDVSAGLVKSETQPKNFELCISNGINIPLEVKSVHIAYSNQVMEHLHPEDAYDQLREIYNVLVPGGIYICITPNRLSGPWDISRNFDKIATGLHLKEWTIIELTEVFRAVGFSKVTAIISYHGYILSPMLPVMLFIWLEAIIGMMPHIVRRKIANLLTAVKLIAMK